MKVAFRPHHCTQSRDGIRCLVEFSKRDDPSQGMKRFRVRCELDYSAEDPVVFLLNVRAQDHDSQRVTDETFSVTPALPAKLMACDITHNRFDRIEAEVPGVY